MVVNDDDPRGRSLVEAAGNLNPHTFHVWERILAARPWHAVIVIGANYGEMLRTESIPASAAVIAIEPNPDLIPKLRRNLEHLGDRLSMVVCAAGNTSGPVPFFVDSSWSGTSRVVAPDEFNAFPDGTLCVVESMRVDEIVLGFHGLDVCLKVDVEGGEFDVLEGAAGLFERARGFAALVEILHMPREDFYQLVETFQVYVVETRFGRLLRVPRLAGGKDNRALDWYFGECSSIFQDALVVPHGTRIVDNPMLEIGFL